VRVLIATDAWYPQINGVVRTLQSLAASMRRLGVEVEFLSPAGFWSVAMPTYPSLRLAIPNPREIAKRIEAFKPDCIHIATEGPIGLMARLYCARRRLGFTSSYTTRFPEYISARAPIPEAWSYAVLRRFHSAAAATMISTTSFAAELAQRGFKNLRMWTRGVDTDIFTPAEPFAYDLPRPIFISVGRVAVEKNLEAFLSLDLPGSKVVIGEGPQEDELKTRFPDAHFLGVREGKVLASYLAGADVFVFPSLTDTFGIVQLEALACGTPVAAFPVTGPNDVITSETIGALDKDLRAACLRALGCSRPACRDYALGYSWENSARQFVSNLTPLHAGRLPVAARLQGAAKLAKPSPSKPSFPMA
jgi:1,2-diacylglycerol 3-alpha-glucosyltransferase/glucuronosyltransferase